MEARLGAVVGIMNSVEAVGIPCFPRRRFLAWHMWWCVCVHSGMYVSVCRLLVRVLRTYIGILRVLWTNLVPVGSLKEPEQFARTSRLQKKDESESVYRSSVGK